MNNLQDYIYVILWRLLLKDIYLLESESKQRDCFLFLQIIHRRTVNIPDGWSAYTF